MGLSDIFETAGDFLFGEELIGPVVDEAARPNVGGLFGDFGKDDLGDLLTGAGAIYGSFQQPEQVAFQQQGQPQYVQDFYKNTYFPALQDLAQMDYIGRPTRMAAMPGDANFDPIFGSYGVADLQDYMDQQAVTAIPAAVEPTQAAPAREEASTQDDIYRALGLQALSQPSGDMARGITNTGRGFQDLQGVLQQDSITNPFMPGFEMGQDEALSLVGQYQEAMQNPVYSNIFSGPAALREDNPQLAEDYAMLRRSQRFDPTINGFGGYVAEVGAPIIAGAIAAPIGAGLGSLASGALGGGTLGGLASQGADFLFNQALGAAR